MGAYSENVQKLSKTLGSHFSKELTTLITNVTQILLVIVAVFTLLEGWGINITALLGGVGIAGAALAFASQDVIKNVFGSVSLLLDRTFSVGDRISIEGIEGIVEDIGLRSTTIRRTDKALISIPNGNIMSVPVTNFSRIHQRLVTLKFQVEVKQSNEQIQLVLHGLRKYLRDHTWVEMDTHKSPIIISTEGISVYGIDIYVHFFINHNSLEATMAMKDDCTMAFKQLCEIHKVPLAIYWGG